MPKAELGQKCAEPSSLMSSMHDRHTVDSGRQLTGPAHARTKCVKPLCEDQVVIREPRPTKLRFALLSAERFERLLDVIRT